MPFMKILQNMEPKMSIFPFELSTEEIRQNSESCIDAVFSCLQSEFLIMPKGDGFIEYPVFERGYEALKAATNGFSILDPDRVLAAVVSEPISMVVLRSMLGFTPPEWGYVTTQRTGVPVSQGFVRTLDRKARMAPDGKLNVDGVSRDRLNAMIQTACHLLLAGVPEVDIDQLHRLNKADTRNGSQSIRNLAGMGAPYAMLLYERFLGRPFAGHRDSVSELIGDSLESAIEDVLNRRSEDNPKYEVIACIGGRGFGVRREDMKKMILATRGKVFTLKTLDRLVECTRLKEFKTQ